MGIGAITLPTAGSVTAPTDALALSLGSADSLRYSMGLPMVAVDVPHWPAVMHLNGADAVRHIIEAAVYRTGLLAPSAAMVGTPGGAQATALLDIDVAGNGASIYNPDTDDVLLLGNSAYSSTIYNVDAIGDAISAAGPWPGAYIKVLTEATGDLWLDNVIDIFNDENRGIKWEVVGTLWEPAELLRELIEVTSHPASYQLNLNARDYGTGGNALFANLYAGTWTDCSFGSRGSNVGGALGYMENGANGSGDNPAAGTYKYVHQGYRSVDGALSAAGPASGEALNGVKGDIDLTAMTANPDSTADFTRWSRTLKDQARFYRGAEIARTGASDTDDKSDTELTTGAVIYQQQKFRTYRAGHIPRYRWAEEHQGRVFMGGAVRSAPYTAGTAAVTVDSPTVTITGGYPLESHEGRTFSVASTSETYLIVAVSESAGTYTLDRDYEGTTNGTATYEVKDDRNADDLNFTEVGLVNQLPATNNIKGIVSRAGEGSLAGVSLWEALIVFTRDNVWRLIGQNPNSYALRPVAGASGVLSSRSVVQVDGVLYWVSPTGIYRWDGQSAPLNIARPPAQQGVVLGINGTIKRINQAHANQAHAHYDQDEKVVRFFVPLDDEVVPGHAIVFDLQTGSFALDRVPDITAAGTVTKPNGDRVTVLGSVTGELFHADISNSDGAYGFEPKTTATAASSRTWTDSAASFPTAGDGLAGVPFWFVDASGNFDRRVIASNTGTVLTFTRHFDTTPSVGWQGYAGAIGGHFKTGRTHFGVPDEDKSVTLLDFMYSPESDGTCWAAVATNQGTLSIPPFSTGQIDMSETDGHTKIVWGGTGRAHQFETWAIEPGCDPHFLSIKLHVNARSRLVSQV